MSPSTVERVEVLVVGAGPAGLAAASAAAEHGCGVLVLDDNPAAGGQIWRADSVIRAEQKDGPRARALRRFEGSGARLLHSHRGFAAPAPGRLQAVHERDDGRASAATFQYRQLVIATGARERFLPFPGWTLPGVFGAGGLQALVKGGLSVAGRRVVVAGSGPLLLAVAAHLRADGAEIACVAEQAPLGRIAPFAASLCTQPGKLAQGLRYRRALGRAPFRTGCWPVEALPSASGDRLGAVRLTDGARTWSEPCDLLACGFHLVANTELGALLGVAFDGNVIRVSAEQRTSLPGVYCAGEPTGIAGLDAALVQGEIAGLACAGQDTAPLLARAAAQARFGARLNRAFALRPELRLVPAPGTLVCRCEDVTFGALQGHTGWTDAKLQTRCGMGPCQGRVCGPAVEFLFGWKPASVRPPLFPVPLGALAQSDFDTTKETP